MKNKLIILLVCSSFLLVNSCKKDETPVPVAKVTYTADVKPIFVASCTPCHMAAGTNPNKWDNYTMAKNKINVILDRVQRDPSIPGFMPKNGSKLSDAKIATLKKWMADGLLEN